MRAFRRNLGASSSKLSHEPSSHGHHHDAAAAKVEAGKKGLFVKVHMDGVPIGRKVDLAAHGSYDRLSAAVDQLFRGLLAGTCARITFWLVRVRGCKCSKPTLSGCRGSSNIRR